MFTADNMVVSELNDTVEVCFSASIPSAIPVELEIRYLPSLTATAEGKMELFYYKKSQPH